MCVQLCDSQLKWYAWCKCMFFVYLCLFHLLTRGLDPSHGDIATTNDVVQTFETITELPANYKILHP